MATKAKNWAAAFCMAAMASAAVTAALAQSAPAPNVAVQTVDAMNKIWGKHPGMRANHAKGVVVTGSFTPTKAGPALSTASLFAGPTIPVTVRFSDSTGLPTIPDGAAGANPHGMAVKFFLPGGTKMDLVANSLKFFPVATGAQFLQLLQAIAASGPGVPSPTPVQQFFAAHPSAPAAFGSVSTPTSFAHETYNGVDAFIFVNAAGKRQAFRFKIVPLAGDRYLTPAAAAAKPADFLIDELPERLTRGPVKFRLEAQLASPADDVTDATKPWPATDKVVDLGTITLTKAAPNSLVAQKSLLFIPGNVPPGIVPSGDPLIQARDQAYGVSFARRLAN